MARPTFDDADAKADCDGIFVGAAMRSDFCRMLRNRMLEELEKALEGR